MGIFSRGPLLGLAALGSLALAAPAWAGCGDTATVSPAAWTGGSEAQLWRANLGTPSIIGMWSVQFFAGGNMIDFGYAQWHADGTEIMNSGGRSPASENFCLGVWAQTGPFSYKLNHFALSYDPGTGALNGKVNIKEDVTLDQKGAQFDGTFTIDVFDPNSNALLQHVGGRIVGRRVAVN
ncbi:hypothetical protein [Phenylobacterium sp.]|uniref:hypothetical protein n=1 Tax=Phenylobacterium sp. TaxID=1871053 RepID=UPI002606E459|nr:hypothetical protein [Phenylobacterium sp.]